MKKNKKILMGIIIGIVILIIILLFFIYLNLFKNDSSSRFKNSDKYTLTNNEKNSVKQEIKELDNIKKVDVYTNNKIINIHIVLKEDIEFDELNNTLNNTLNNFKEKNLKYYDIEVFVESENKESETYPKIGYKHKTSKDFAW